MQNDLPLTVTAVSNALASVETRFKTHRCHSDDVTAFRCVRHHNKLHGYYYWSYYDFVGSGFDQMVSSDGIWEFKTKFKGHNVNTLYV